MAIMLIPCVFPGVTHSEGLGKLKPLEILMKIGILIDLCMLIKSLHGPQSRRTHRLTYRGHLFMMKMTNMTFGDLCRSIGGSYDFGAIETFDQHAKIYQYTDFHQNRSDFSFPIYLAMCNARKNTRYNNVWTG